MAKTALGHHKMTDTQDPNEELLKQIAEEQRWVDCLALIANKDRQALMKFYQHFVPKVKAFAFKQGAPSDVHTFVEELAQEVMLKVWNKAESFDSNKAKVTTWLFTVVRNTRIDLLRKKSNQPLILVSEEVWSEELEEGPLHNLQIKRTQAVIQENLRQLTVDHRVLLTKVYFEGRTHSQIAQELDLPLGTVKSRIRIALNKLNVLFDR
jgi:RNA polymerase sigma-70 factor (ECF subfamily)